MKIEWFCTVLNYVIMEDFGMYTCCVCGYDGLEEEQYNSEGGWPTFCVCPCCGFESGFDDDAKNEPQTIEEYRDYWIKLGSMWFSPSTKKPKDWNLKTQLKQINVEL
jgi:hypothetical protein